VTPALLIARYHFHAVDCMHAAYLLASFSSQHLCVSSGFRRGVNEIRAVLGFFAASNGCFLLTFRDNLLVPYLRVKGCKLHSSYF
jgi:hypothetical protein